MARGAAGDKSTVINGKRPAAVDGSSATPLTDEEYHHTQLLQAKVKRPKVEVDMQGGTHDETVLQQTGVGKMLTKAVNAVKGQFMKSKEAEVKGKPGCKKGGTAPVTGGPNMPVGGGPGMPLGRGPSNSRGGPDMPDEEDEEDEEEDEEYEEEEQEGQREKEDEEDEEEDEEYEEEEQDDKDEEQEEGKDSDDVTQHAPAAPVGTSGASPDESEDEEEDGWVDEQEGQSEKEDEEDGWVDEQEGQSEKEDEEHEEDEEEGASPPQEPIKPSRASPSHLMLRQGDLTETETNVLLATSEADRAAPGMPTGGGKPRDLQALQLLLKRQRNAMPLILEELKKHGRKQSHWAWWAFPTEAAGASEPGGETYVTRATAPALLADPKASASWRSVLEKLCDLAEAGCKQVLPRVDHGRVHHFLKFWRSLPDNPAWLASVLVRVDRAASGSWSLEPFTFQSMAAKKWSLKLRSLGVWKRTKGKGKSKGKGKGKLTGKGKGKRTDSRRRW